MNEYRKLFLFVLAQLEYLSNEDSSGIDELRNEIWIGHLFVIEQAYDLGLICDEERTALIKKHGGVWFADFDEFKKDIGGEE